MQTSRDASPPATRFSLKGLLLLVGCLAVLFTFVRFMYGLTQVPNDAYATWAAGDLLLAYMSDHDGSWPSSWDELEASFDASGETTTMLGPFSEVKSRIHIDFDFDPDEAMRSINEEDLSPGFRVVVLKNGRDTHWSGMEPNQRVFEFLKERKYDPDKGGPP